MSLYINICICKVHNMLRTSLNIKRDLTVSCASRVMTGPDVVGCRCRQLLSVCPGPDNIFRPVVVTFEEFKDREEVLRKAGVLKGNNIHVTEDMSRSRTVSSRMLLHPVFISRRVRESRTELRKFMRDVKKQNPAANILLQYDKLFVNHRCYVWSDFQGKVVEYIPVNRKLKCRYPSHISTKG